MDDQSSVVWGIKGRVGHILLNRPKALNALAQITPKSVWEKGWTPEGPAG